jgi:hypothetical protein
MRIERELAAAANNSGGNGGESAVDRPVKRARIHADNAARVQLDDLPSRHNLRNMKYAKEKVVCMMAIEAERPREWSKMTSGAKSFVSKFLMPTASCVEKHFNGNIDAFCAKYPNYTHTKFPAEHCCD